MKLYEKGFLKEVKKKRVGCQENKEGAGIRKESMTA
jgi:hypothetical protein